MKHDEGLWKYDEVSGISVGFDPGLLMSFLGERMWGPLNIPSCDVF